MNIAPVAALTAFCWICYACFVLQKAVYIIPLTLGYSDLEGEHLDFNYLAGESQVSVPLIQVPYLI